MAESAKERLKITDRGMLTGDRGFRSTEVEPIGRETHTATDPKLLEYGTQIGRASWECELTHAKVAHV